MRLHCGSGLVLVGLVLGVLLFSGAPAAHAASADELLRTISWDIEGGDYKLVKDQNAMVIRGYGTIVFKGMEFAGVKEDLKLQARNLVVFLEGPAPRYAYAEGDVNVEFGDQLMYCDTLYLDIKTFQGEATDVRATGRVPEEEKQRVPSSLDLAVGGVSRPRAEWSETALNRGFVRARKVRINSREHQELFDATMTTDNSPKPIYSFGARAAHLRRREKVESWHNVLRIGRVPIFYFPYVLKDLRYDWPWMRLTMGRSDRWGVFSLSSWGMDLEPQDESFFRPEKIYWDIDWREERGWAGGMTMKYEMGHRKSIGHFGGYYTKETDISAREDAERAIDDNEYGDLYQDKERWRVFWDHYQELPAGWDMRIDVDAYSDRDFQKEYFNREYNEEKEPEAIFDLRKLTDDFIFEIVARPRVNDFQTQAEYLPELRFTLPGMPLGRTGIFMRNDTRIGVVNKRIDEDLSREQLVDEHGLDDDFEYGKAFRAHTDLRFYKPFNIGRVLTFTPYVGGLASYYEDVRDDDVGHTRSAGLWGFELTGRWVGRFGGDRVRHLVEPSIRFTGNEDPTIEPKDLWEVDELELYNELHFWTFALHQSWEVERNRRRVNLIDLDIQTKLIPLEAEANDFNMGQHWTPLEIDLVYRPTDTLTVHGDLSIDMEEGYVEDGSLGMVWRFRDRLRMHLRHQYRRGDTVRNPGPDRSSETMLALRWLASDKYTLEYAVTREWCDSTDGVSVTGDYAIDHGLLKQRISLIRNMKVFDLALSVIRDARYDDTSVYLSLSPRGIPEMDRAYRDDPAARLLSEDGRYPQPSLVEDEAPAPEVPETVEAP